jgi:hypothetical protein
MSTGYRRRFGMGRRRQGPRPNRCVSAVFFSFLPLPAGAKLMKSSVLTQVNKLLMEKISSQGDTISQRERELEREREHGFVLFFLPSLLPTDVSSLNSNLKASLSTSTSSQEDRKRLEKLENEVEKSREQVKEMEDKLQRAKVVRRSSFFTPRHTAKCCTLPLARSSSRIKTSVFERPSPLPQQCVLFSAFISSLLLTFNHS